VRETDLFTRASKLVSLVLRHQPQAFGITLDKAGFAAVADILALLKAQGLPSRFEDLETLIVGRDKQRFELDAEKSHIRATHGHSVKVELGNPAATPPAELFHGTVAEAVETILAEGLKPQQRQYVHLSSTRETASTVAQRRGPPVVLTVDSARMHADGMELFHSPGDVWLTASVPARYLKR
jgi:putative RNA 2'-phosphotransferase